MISSPLAGTRCMRCGSSHASAAHSISSCHCGFFSSRQPLEGMSAHVERALGAGNWTGAQALRYRADRSQWRPAAVLRSAADVDPRSAGAGKFGLQRSGPRSNWRGHSTLRRSDQAIEAIVARHEVLRTTFHKSAHGEPKQVIALASGYASCLSSTCTRCQRLASRTSYVPLPVGNQRIPLISRPVRCSA